MHQFLHRLLWSCGAYIWIGIVMAALADGFDGAGKSRTVRLLQSAMCIALWPALFVAASRRHGDG